MRALADRMINANFSRPPTLIKIFILSWPKRYARKTQIHNRGKPLVYLGEYPQQFFGERLRLVSREVSLSGRNRAKGQSDLSIPG